MSPITFLWNAILKYLVMFKVGILFTSFDRNRKWFYFLYRKKNLTIVNVIKVNEIDCIIIKKKFCVIKLTENFLIPSFFKQDAVLQNTAKITPCNLTSGAGSKTPNEAQLSGKCKESKLKSIKCKFNMNYNNLTRKKD